MDWLDAATRVAGGLDGGGMVGGPPRFVWHTFEADPARLDAVPAARALIAAGNAVHFTLNPLTGHLAQLLPASRAGRGLRHPGGVQTNRLGTVCLQVEVIGFAGHPFTASWTPAGRQAAARLVAFARTHGIPDAWPAGPPPAYPGGSSPRSVSTWTGRAGHYGHSQVPGNDHGDPGAIDTRALLATAPPPAPVVAHAPTGEDPDMRVVLHTGDSRPFLIAGGHPHELDPATIRDWCAVTGQDPEHLPKVSAAMLALLAA